MGFIRRAAVGLIGWIRNRGLLFAATDTSDVCRSEVETDSAKFEREVEATCAYKKTKFIPNESK